MTAKRATDGVAYIRPESGVRPGEFIGSAVSDMAYVMSKTR